MNSGGQKVWKFTSKLFVGTTGRDIKMIYIKNLEDGVELFKALGSEVRVSIIRLLLKNKEMNMNEIASSLNITNGALTSHIRKMEDVGLIQVISDFEGHGNQKVCRMNQDRILVDITSEENDGDMGIFETEVPVGQYMNYEVHPTCGISTVKSLIGEADDPRYFAHPDRIKAGILWFSKGYVEYQIPNLLPAAQKIDEIIFSMELSSEAPGVNNDWPSDITFIINDVPVGCWTSPGDYGDVRGIFTPDWWFTNWNQYGLLKVLIINKKGTFIDGLKISDVSTEYFRLDYKSIIRLRLEVREDALHMGGLTLFGSGFGNYGQGIKVRIRYSPMKTIFRQPLNESGQSE